MTAASTPLEIVYLNPVAVPAPAPAVAPLLPGLRNYYCCLPLPLR